MCLAMSFRDSKGLYDVVCCPCHKCGVFLFGVCVQCCGGPQIQVSHALETEITCHTKDAVVTHTISIEL